MATDTDFDADGVTDTFRYGSVVLAYVRTESLSDEDVRDPSGVNYLYTKTRLTVEGILAGGLPPSSAPSEPAADICRRLEHDLLRPGQSLRYRIGGRTVLAVDGPPDHFGPRPGGVDNPAGRTPATTADPVWGPNIQDAANGPFPQSVSFPLVTDGSIVVRFTVECNRVTCVGGASDLRGYASNRFTQSESYDQNGYRTLTTTGVLVGRSDLRVAPDQLRDRVLPPVPNGHQRLGSEWTMSDDGLRLGYRLVDKEYYLGPPPGARTADGDLTILTNQTGTSMFGQVTVKLEGGKDCPKNDLMNLCVLIARSRIGPYLYKNGKGETMGQALVWRTRLYHNACEFSIKGRLDPSLVRGQDVRNAPPPKADPPAQQPPNLPPFFQPGGVPNGQQGQPLAVGPDKFFGISTGPFDRPIPGSPQLNQLAIAPAVRGFASIGAILAGEYQDPCVQLAVQSGSGGFSDQPFDTSLSGVQSGGSPHQPGGKWNPFPDQLGNFAFVALSASAPSPPTVPPGSVPSFAGGSAAAAGMSIPVPGVIGPGAPATIRLGSVSAILPTPTNDATEVPYDLYFIEIDLHQDTGQRALLSTGVGSDGKPVKRPMVSLYNPAVEMEVVWTAVRTGQLPEIPDPIPPDAGTDACNYCLKGMAFSEASLEWTTGGLKKHSISGRYDYSVLDPSLVPLVEPIPPFLVNELKGTPDDPSTDKSTPDTIDPSRGSMGGYSLNPDLIWWRLKTVALSAKLLAADGTKPIDGATVN